MDIKKRKHEGQSCGKCTFTSVCDRCKNKCVCGKGFSTRSGFKSHLRQQQAQENEEYAVDILIINILKEIVEEIIIEEDILIIEEEEEDVSEVYVYILL